MPTFEELLHVNLPSLQSAAEDWAATATLLKKVVKEACDDVRATSTAMARRSTVTLRTRPQEVDQSR
ncbi:hypothetical protein [Streptomyces puniciscabiei]|uniref:hypothetical protein n=1 Tax=Streptomyces puniciscabiei TaxID=164348 RepID=UPI000A43A6BC|nr:hypothetical protein [Streptomyces puniciscabiei]